MVNPHDRQRFAETYGRIVQQEWRIFVPADDLVFDVDAPITPIYATTTAEKRARDLLKSMLNPYQVQTLAQFGFIDIRGSEGGQFRVFDGIGISHNVLDTQHLVSYCYHLARTTASDVYPPSDHLIAQLTLLVLDEPRVRRYPAARISWGLGLVPSGKLPQFMPWRCE